MDITQHIFESYLHCKLKAFLKLAKQSGVVSNFEKSQTEFRENYLRQSVREMQDQECIGEAGQSLNSDLAKGEDVLFKPIIASQGLVARCDMLKKVSGESALGSFHYVPVRFTPSEKISKIDELLLGFEGLILGCLQKKLPDYGNIVHGKWHRVRHVKLDRQIALVSRTVREIRVEAAKGQLPMLHLNDHCKVCELQESCKAKAKEMDDLSLIRGIPEKMISRLNKRGIFTVTQYSYTFRPRRKRNKSRRLFELQALAIRDNKTYILEKPELPRATTNIFLDVEGDPDRDFYYLIGVVVDNNGVIDYYSYWADDMEEKPIFYQFLRLLRGYSDCAVFHYGSYETKFLKKMRTQVNAENAEEAEKALKRSFNVLKAIYPNVYFPAYSNELKEIARVLGFKWSHEGASGIQSVLWRRAWEINKDSRLKASLVEYNLEDCHALKRVVDFLYRVQNNANEGSTLTQPEYLFASELKEKFHYKKFGKVDFYYPDLEYINQCAYFDYQREKIAIRQSSSAKHRTKHRRRRKKIVTFRANKVIALQPPERCPNCGRRFRKKWGLIKAYVYQNCSKKVLDLLFKSNGVKRYTVEYKAARYKCAACKDTFTKEDFLGLGKYGHGLISLVIYFNVAVSLPLNRVKESLRDLFSIDLARGTLQVFKEKASSYYEGTYQHLIEKIRGSHFISVDETQVKIGKEKKYVWVFTNMEEVIFIFSHTREGDFIKEFLSGFKGVLVSDFYAVYDSLDCPQQKCLIHLIRDMNDDLLDNPFDEEYKGFARDFTILLRSVVETIDRHGLSRRHLERHSQGISEFFDNFLGKKCSSEAVKKYQKRFQKNRNKLFTFINFDGVPWNNNCAEHAIKHFATYRNVTPGICSETGIKQYLVLLSIFQTCKYKDINFLEFLLSKSKCLSSYPSR